MNKSHIWPVALAWLAMAATAGSAQELAVFAARDYKPALREIVSSFTNQTGFAVKLTLGRSEALAERIRNGAAADLFFPAGEDAMQRVVEKGLVDVALKRNVLALAPGEPPAEGGAPEPRYTSAAVLNNAANRLQAMAFLEYLVSEPARAVFARHGFALP